MKLTENIDLKVAIGISLTGVLIVCYLWTFVNGGNHWDLFATPIEKWLMQYSGVLKIVFSGVLVMPLLLKRDKKRVIVALFSMPVFLFLSQSFIKFLD